MSSKIQFNLQHSLPDHLEMIYTSILDFKSFGEIHPFMKEVTLLNDNHSEYKEYKVVEEIYFLGLIKNHPTYTVQVLELEKNKHIRYTSPVKKFIFLSVDIRFSKNKNGSLLVTETFEITSNKIVGMVFAGILKKAHLQFFKNLRSLLHTAIEDINPN